MSPQGSDVEAGLELDLELYRRDVLVPESPPIRLSLIDISPQEPERTLLFLHGFAGQATQWRYQLEDLSDRNRVLALDLRGHGRSEPAPDGYSMPALLSDLICALDQAGAAGHVDVIGHSFGGAIAAEFASAHPDRVDRLVLIATPIEYELNSLYRTALTLPSPILQMAAPFTRGWLAAEPAVLKSLYDNCMAGWDGRRTLSALACPTLVIRGDRDRVFERPDFEEVGRLIPGAEEVNVGASGHMVMLERRKAVDRALRRFLGGKSTSWRNDDSPELARENLRLQTKPWLAHYEEGVPDSIAIPPASMHQLLRSTARRFPKRPAILFEGKTISYRELDQLADRFASGLKAVGLQPGDRAVILLPNLPEFVISYFAVMRLGCIPVFSLPVTEEGELLRQIGLSGARALVTLDQFASTARKALEGTDLDWVILTDGGEFLPGLKRLGFRSRQRKGGREGANPVFRTEGVHRFSEVLKTGRKVVAEAISRPEELAVVIFTGGTTDAPKGVMLSQGNLVANALQARHWMPEAEEGGEKFLCVVPFTHSYGMTAALNVPITIGAGLIIKPRFEVEEVLQAIRRYQPTIFPGVPNMFLAIKDYPGVRKYRIDSIKACLSGAAPLPVEVQESFEKLTRGHLVEAYGLTEASPATHANPLNGLRKEGTIGIPLPSTEARVVDLRRASKVMPPGQIGELAVRGPQVMLGYWDDPGATAQAITPEGWLLTGDIVQMDPDGYFRLIARKADMWYPGSPANPAFPRDIEEVIYEIPQVKETAVISIANKPIAFVIAQHPPPTAESIIAYCKRRLPPDLVPRLVIFVDEFPRSFIGKVLRRELRNRYELQQTES
jgi:long-chain acyl-CoA synthetase